MNDLSEMMNLLPGNALDSSTKALVTFSKLKVIMVASGPDAIKVVGNEYSAIDYKMPSSPLGKELDDIITGANISA